MHPLHVLKALVGIGACVWLVIQVCWHENRASANRRPTEALRQAKDLCRQWEKGFSAASVPSRPPALADELLREVEESGADEPVRAEAKELRAAFHRRPHYLRMAANAAAFRAEANRYLALHAAAGARPEAAIGPVQPGVLVVTVNTEPGGEPEAFFDAEAVDACGPAAAAGPAAVRTLITLAWDKQQIGEYRVTELALNGKKVPVRPGTEWTAGYAYRQTCTATAFRLPGGGVVGRQQFTADDPEKRGQGQPTAETQVRAEVVRFLAGVRVVEAKP